MKNEEYTKVPVPVMEISKGHCLTAFEKVEDGYVLMFCIMEKSATPGTYVTDEEAEKAVPAFGIKLWGVESMRILAESLTRAADRYEKEGKNGN